MYQTTAELTAMIDHTNLKAFAEKHEIKQLCEEAVQYGFQSVMVNAVRIPECREYLGGSGIIIGTVVSFPLGATSIKAKVQEATTAMEAGAIEIDYVLDIGAVKDGNFEQIRSEMRELTEACHAAGAAVKVIFENCYLTKDEIKAVAAIAGEIRPDFIKTSTGFGTSGAMIEDVRMMKETAGDMVAVKAAGGIRTLQSFQSMTEAGAARIGTSNSVAILKEYEALKAGTE